MEVVEGKITGLRSKDVVYPLLVSLQGRTKRGKTFFGASFPNAVLLDFISCKMGFAKLEFDAAAMNRTVGEGFRSIFRPERKDGEVQWVSKIPGFDFQSQYCYVKTWDQFN